MKRLAPPIVGGDIQAGNGTGLVNELGGLFFERHALDQVGCTLLGRKARIQVSRLLCVLHAGCQNTGGTGHRRSKHPQSKSLHPSPPGQPVGGYQRIGVCQVRQRN